MRPSPDFRYQRSQSDFVSRPPPVRAQYFYASPIPIDDPLSPLPPPTNAAPVPSSLSPQPFSNHDNSALEKAWLQLRTNSIKQETQHTGVETPGAGSSKQNGKNTAGRPGLSQNSSTRRDSTSERPQQLAASIQRKTTGQKDTFLGRLKASRPSGSNTSSNDSLPLNSGPNSIIKPGTLLDNVDGEDKESDSAADGLTRTPFIRAPSRKEPEFSNQDLTTSTELVVDESHVDRADNDSQYAKPESSLLEFRAQVPVGVARLHHVLMPKLEMQPIYWSPVNDTANVIRATWFYQDTMLPVEANVANLIEANYLTVQPWTQTWKDELNSAVEVGPDGEAKITFPLWSERLKSSEERPITSSSMLGVANIEQSLDEKDQETLQSAITVIEQSSTMQDTDHVAVGITSYGRDGRARQYKDASVLFANEKEAYLLRPSLQPSSYHGRRPLANYIRKGRPVGVCVVRGFSMDIWHQLHPPRRDIKTSRALNGLSAPKAAYSTDQVNPPDPQLALSSKPLVTDLVLVIHGIGQKLSERMESFHFTHSINSFRREVNVELGTPAVKQHLRSEAGGIMVLPINWRSTLSFEDGGYKNEAQETTIANSFTLKDITPDSLPSVRNVISDVMLDIPYYLSEHQPKMISAVVKEANRVFRLWCDNNPGFRKSGRVHIIAHSLGSVMAIDILSNQQNSVQQASQADERSFVFDVKNLYLCGSPAALFLLIKNQSLTPRKDRNKPGSDGEDELPGVAGHEGTYGCLAVDNIYNIINPYDPVAYRLNATVDAAYAHSLKQAVVPSASTSWFGWGNPFRSDTNTARRGASKPRPDLTDRLPSNVELETHNFTREEIAERKAFLLNDNGQLDYFLKYGGGPLEIQYLTMLGAHSSYWLSKDFIRFVVIEIGRKLGKDGALEATKAVKKNAVVRP